MSIGGPIYQVLDYLEGRERGFCFTIADLVAFNEPRNGKTKMMGVLVRLANHGILAVKEHGHYKPYERHVWLLTVWMLVNPDQRIYRIFRKGAG